MILIYFDTCNIFFRKILRVSNSMKEDLICLKNAMCIGEQTILKLQNS